MADIDIQKKEHKGSFWPWILGLLALIALIWIGFEALSSDDESDNLATEEVAPLPVDPSPQDAQPTADVTQAVQEYLAFVEGEANMGLDHEYTSRGLTHLSAALNAIISRDAAGDMGIQATRDTLAARARAIQQDPQATTHARSVHAAFTSAADLLAQLQQNRFTGLEGEVAEVRQAAQAVSPSGDVLNQKEAVKRFFTEAGDVLERMAQSSTGIAER